MTKSIIARFISGLVLLAISTVLVITSSGQSLTAQAQTVSNYSTTWDATKVLTINNSDGEIAIGPSEWTVTGCLAATCDSGSVDKYKEAWSVPSQLPTFQVSEGGNTKHCATGGSRLCMPFSNNQTNWLVGFYPYTTFNGAGVVGNPGGGFSVKSKPISEVENKSMKLKLTPGYSNDIESDSGKGVSCSQGTISSIGGGKLDAGPSSCNIATGAYGWTRYGENDTSYETSNGAREASNWTAIANGMAMPLKWTVKGTFCPANSNQSACN